MTRSAHFEQAAQVFKDQRQFRTEAHICKAFGRRAIALFELRARRIEAERDVEVPVQIGQPLPGQRIHQVDVEVVDPARAQDGEVVGAQQQPAEHRRLADERARRETQHDEVSQRECHMSYRYTRSSCRYRPARVARGRW